MKPMRTFSCEIVYSESPAASSRVPIQVLKPSKDPALSDLEDLEPLHACIDATSATASPAGGRSEDELATVNDLLGLDAEAAPGLEPAFDPLDQCLVAANRVDLLDRPVFAVRAKWPGRRGGSRPRL